MPDSEHKLFLLDGMALVYRAHFAFATNPIRTAAGRNTSAIYGFVNTLLELMTKQNPTHLAVVFDTAAPTARHMNFPPTRPSARKCRRNSAPRSRTSNGYPRLQPSGARTRWLRGRRHHRHPRA